MQLHRLIDHSLLKADTTPDQIRQLCREAREYGFASVCVNPCFVSLCAEELTRTNVQVCTVIGFPLGASTTNVKVFETKEAIWNGAREVDMVVAVGQLKAGNLDYVWRDIQAVVAAANNSGVPVKVIIETGLLTDEEKRLACRLALEAGAAFVKTSSGFNGGGATVDDIRLMRSVVGDQAKIKASGGIRDLATARAMVEAGADRLGTSSGVKIFHEEREAA